MFNIRVGGILINDNNEVLVSDELIRGSYYTKFCGGGLELGEGTINCVIREFKEEMNIEIEVIEHLYTTDFYQKSIFNPQHQLISIYYLVKAMQKIDIPVKQTPFEFNQEQLDNYSKTGQIESFRFVKWNEFSAECMTLPIDKIAAKMVKQRFKK